MDLWLTPDGDLAKNSDGELLQCDDCPCSTCGAYATTYAVVRIGGGPIPNATADFILEPTCRCPPCSAVQIDVDCYWSGEFHQSPDFGYEGRTGQLWFRHTDLRWVVRVYNGPFPACGSFFAEFAQDVPDINTIPGNYGSATMTIT